MFKDSRNYIEKIKTRLKEKAVFNTQINKELKELLIIFFGKDKINLYLKGVYPRTLTKELVIEVNNNFFANELVLRKDLIKSSISYYFEKISIRLV